MGGSESSRAGVRAERRRENVGFDMRNNSGHRGSCSAEERRRWNQQLEAALAASGGGGAVGRMREERSEREREDLERWDSRVRVWEGRRRRSW